MGFEYQAEKLSQARRALMLPHSRGEAASIGEAFEVCSRAFHNFGDDGLDHNAGRWVAKIKELMKVDAERLTNEQKLELREAVDELAHWFERNVWEGC